MAMAKLKHGSHDCVLTSPEIVANGICNMCYRDEPVEFACNPCNFDLCKPCSKLPQKVYHDFHPNHYLELCLHRDDGKSREKLCSGCGNLFSGSYYECKEGCEIYLDMDCAFLKNIATSWNTEERLHYSHAHLIKRCRPGLKVKRSCLLCELPLSPSSICYGCVQCNSFVHERCLDFPREIQHPVHPAHSLIRLDFTNICGKGKDCDACGNHIDGVPFGCPKCDFNIHLRCADSLLRGLTHKSHHHKHSLFYAVTHKSNARNHKKCQICWNEVIYTDYSYYHCVECKLMFHFECLKIPESVFKKSYHIHPLRCKKFLPEPEDDSLEYCGVCETIVHKRHHVYSCEDCEFVAHIACILRERTPSPLYLKDLYSCDDDKTSPTDNRQDSDEVKEFLITDISHNHLVTSRIMMRFIGTSRKICNICHDDMVGRIWQCKTCSFKAHDYCVKLRVQPSRHRVHSNHLLTLLPSHPAGVNINCDNCKVNIQEFNLFCRICSFIICTKCVKVANQSLGELQRGQKFIGIREEKCLRGGIHGLVEVMVSRSYMMVCTICDGRLCGKVLSCVTCGDLYHHLCFESFIRGRPDHPLHPDHELRIKLTRSKCIACKLSIKKYGYNCSTCKLNFHMKCVKEVVSSTTSGKMESHDHKHFLYNFWMDDSRSKRACSVCGEPCGASFYGCIDCNKFNAHVECIGFPNNVKNRQHQHTVKQSSSRSSLNCSLCGINLKSCDESIYSCNHCEDAFHMKCIMSMVKRKATTEEEQIIDIYLMFIERDLYRIVKEGEYNEYKYIDFVDFDYSCILPSLL